MVDRIFSSRTRHSFMLICTSSLMLFLLSIALSACDITLFTVNCAGAGVSCKSGSATPTPNATALVSNEQSITQNTPLVRDPLSRQDGNRWSTRNGCSFHDGAYYVTYSAGPSAFGCDSTKLQYDDAAIQMDVTLFSGDSAGIIFRVDPTFSEFYSFQITDQGQCALLVYDKYGTNSVLPDKTSKAIHKMGQKNTLLVIAKGSDFQLFINGSFVGEAQDTSLTNGFVGVSVTDYSSHARARFSNLVIYQV